MKGNGAGNGFDGAHKSHHRSENSDDQDEKTHQEFVDRLLMIIGHEKPLAFARRAGIAKSTMHSILKQGIWPGRRTLEKMLAHLGVSREWLIDGEEPPEDRTFRPTSPTVRNAAKSFDHLLGERLERAISIMEGASQAARVIPSDAVRQQLVGLQIKYGVSADDIALLLSAMERGGDGAA